MVRRRSAWGSIVVAAGCVYNPQFPQAPADATATSTGAATDGSVTSGPSDSTVVLPSCGDGVLDPGEECDDGNDDASDACAPGCKEARCGDGFVGPGEGCDDGNDDDTDACVKGCVPASCGDGFVGPGEACDDGNDDDTDACVQGCAPASCGDGFVGPREQCDDGNQADGDACTATCGLPSCGDGVLDPGEACDDGNDDESDGCTTLCEPPNCDDGLWSGEESDVDCGGATCGVCPAGAGCEAAADCETGVCGAGATCELRPNCLDIKVANPDAQDGVYMIDPDGDSPEIHAFRVHCDMTTDGGGWTLALRARGDTSTFDYDSLYWTTDELFNQDKPELAWSEAKLASFTTVPFKSILLGLQTPIDPNAPIVLNTITLDMPANSLLELFLGPYVATLNARADWLALVPGSALQPYCNRQGVNSLVSLTRPRSRIGILGNENHDCLTPDSYIGIGNKGSGCEGQPQASVGNMVSCNGNNPKTLKSLGVIYVR